MNVDETSSSGAAEDSEQKDSLSTGGGISDSCGAEGAEQSSIRKASLQDTQQGAFMRCHCSP